MKKVIVLISISSLIVAFLLGFIDVVQKQPVENKAVFTYSISSIPMDLKMVGSLDKRIQDIICATSVGLIEIDNNGEIVPSLAESVEVRDNGLEYDFKINSNMNWSDGSKITTADIAMFFREILTEEDSNQIGALLNVYGAKEFREGLGTFSQNVGIIAKDDRIIFRLNSKDEKFIEELSAPQYRVRKNILLWENINKNYDKIIYSGDYKIESVDLTEVTLKRNESSDNKLLENIKIIGGESEELAMAAFEVGNRDIVINPPKSQLDRLKKENRLVTLKSKKAMYLAFNPNSKNLSLEVKREIYRLINNAMGDYQLDNKISIELAEGSYSRDDKEDLLKLQSRRVMSRVTEEDTEIPVVALLLEENSKNKELAIFIKDWFEKNTDIILTYDLINKDKINTIHEETYYNVALIQGETNLNVEESIYKKIINFLPVEYKNELVNLKTDGEVTEMFSKIEDNLFNTFNVLPMMFYNDNICINKDIKNILLDSNGNIDFGKIEK